MANSKAIRSEVGESEVHELTSNDTKNALEIFKK